ncbi:pinensin family lanthipeptide [Roseivirga sp. BDSF3-8]
MKKKMNISSLKVKSFVTNVDNELKVKGGAPDTYYGVNGCSLYRYPCFL